MLTRDEAFALGLVDSNSIDAVPQMVACELNESEDMVRLVDDPFKIRPTCPKSCPFCGDDDLRVGVYSYESCCVSCPCGALVVVVYVDCDKPKPRAKLEAIARWNRRDG